MILKKLFVVLATSISLFAINLYAGTCTTAINCGVHSATCTATGTGPQDLSCYPEEGLCYIKASCGDMPNNIRFCTEQVLRIQDKKPPSRTRDGRPVIDYLCCKNGQAIATGNITDCQ